MSFKRIYKFEGSTAAELRDALIKELDQRIADVPKNKKGEPRNLYAKGQWMALEAFRQLLINMEM